jgi:hypothetical protein
VTAFLIMKKGFVQNDYKIFNKDLVPVCVFTFLDIFFYFQTVNKLHCKYNKHRLHGNLELQSILS